MIILFTTKSHLITAQGYFDTESSMRNVKQSFRNNI